MTKGTCWTRRSTFVIWTFVIFLIYCSFEYSRHFLGRSAACSLLSSSSDALGSHFPLLKPSFEPLDEWVARNLRRKCFHVDLSLRIRAHAWSSLTSSGGAGSGLRTYSKTNTSVDPGAVNSTATELRRGTS